MLYGVWEGVGAVWCEVGGVGGCRCYMVCGRV